MSVARSPGFDTVVRALVTRAASLTGADGVILGLTDGPRVCFQLGIGVFEGTEFEASLLVPSARPLLERRGLLGDGSEEVSRRSGPRSSASASARSSRPRWSPHRGRAG